MNMWQIALDELQHATDMTRERNLTTDQRMKRAEVWALLSIAQELSLIRHEGINPEFDARVPE